jgi:hypothetical protein
MTKTVRMLKFDPGPYASYVDVLDTPEAIQEILGGYMEEVFVIKADTVDPETDAVVEDGGRIVFLANENGVALDLPHTFTINGRDIRGPVLVTRVVDGEMVGADEDVDRFVAGLILPARPS